MNSEKICKETRSFVNYCELGKLITLTMIDKGISRKQLVRELNITSAAVTQICFGSSKPSLTTIYRLHEILGLDLEELFLAIRKDVDKSSA